MIQDIYPSVFYNEYTDTSPEKDSYIIIFRDESVLVKDELCFPKYCEFKKISEPVYMFSIDKTAYFLSEDTTDIPEGFSFIPILQARRIKLSTNKNAFALYDAYHLYKWYKSSKYCGNCGEKTVHDKTERAMYCPSCKEKIYPRINPAVIVGVINGDKLLLTKYKTGYAHNALVAGFTEFGETLEQTVEREVMEETGIKVKNIRYYKSQPWGIALDILVGFFCEADGNDKITMDDSELKQADWIKREDIVLQPNEYSLTNEMMKMFKEGKIK